MAAISQTTFSDAFSWMQIIWISINISLKFVPRDQIDNVPALAGRLPGEKPLSELMLLSLLMYTCVTRPRWVKPERPWEKKPTALFPGPSMSITGDDGYSKRYFNEMYFADNGQVS